MKTLHLSIAGAQIQITFHPAEALFFSNKLQGDILRHYRSFISKKSKKIDFYIDFYQTYSRELFIKKNGTANKFFVDFCKVVSKKRVVTYYKIGLVQFQFILSNILQMYLARNNGFILHASGVILKKKSMLFCGKPGDGKSTAMRLARSKYSPLADDSIIIKREKDSFLSHQTPFIETNFWEKKKLPALPIGAIFFLKKSKKYAVEEIKDIALIMDRLSKQLLIHEDNMPVLRKNLLKFVQTNKFYYLYFGKNSVKLVKTIEGVV